jgi:hypothetical protein
MSDISLIISSNADQVSKDIKDLGKSALSAVDQALRLTKQMDKLAAAHNNDKISIQQYGNEMAKLQTKQGALYASIGKTTQAEDEQADAANRAAQAAKKLADQTEMLRSKYQKGYAAGKQLAAATREVDTALELGIMSAKEHKAAIALLGQEYQRVGKNSVQFAAMQRMAGKSTNKFGMYSQQVGYQVGDFAVQVQSGTNALVAFGQQGTQLAGLLPGLAGAVLGIGLAIGTAVARSVLDAKKLEIDFKAVISELKKPLESIKPIVEAISGVFKSTGGAVVSVLSIIANNLDRVVLYITVAATAFGTKLVAGLIAAKVATFTLAGAFAFLRMAIIRTGIGAIIIGVAEAIRIFLLLKEQLGGVGPLLDLLKRVFFEIFGKISDKVLWLGYMVKASFYGMKVDALIVLQDLLSKVNSDFVNKFIGSFLGAIRAIGIIVSSIPAMFVAVFKTVKLAVAEGVNDFTGVIGSGINMLREKLNLEKINFGDLIDTSNMTGGDVSGNMTKVLADVKSAYKVATSVDYVAEAHNDLAAAINTADKAQQGALKTAVSLDASYKSKGTALGELSAAYDALGKSSDIDFGNMLRTKTDDDDGSSSEDPIAKLKREIALNKELIGMSKEKVAVLTQVREIQQQLAEDGKTYDEVKLVALVKYNEELKKQRAESQALADTIESSMSDAFMSIADGTKSASDAFRTMAADIIRELYKVLVVQKLVGSFGVKGTPDSGIAGFLGSLITGSGGPNFTNVSANGNAFSGGNVIPYANGGVVGGGMFGNFTNVSANGNVFSGGSQVKAYANGGVVGGGMFGNFTNVSANGNVFSGGSQVKAYANGGVVGRPTVFPMANGGVGLMGEAGPEAIMPLKRGSNGKLGVQAEGGSGSGGVVIHQNFNFAANGDESVKRIIAQAAPHIANMTQKQIMDSRRRGGAMKATFS